MKNLVIFIVVLLVLAILSNLISSRKSKNELPTKKVYNYGHKNYIMTKPEQAFFNTMQDILGNEYYIFPQVNLSSLLDHKVNGQSWKGALSHIQRKSVDFVICSKPDVRSLLAVELDDWSHDREDRIERDTEVERILTAARLPLLRIKNYTKEDLTSRLLTALETS